MEVKDIVANEVARQAEFGMEPSWEDFVIAGIVAGRKEVVKHVEEHATALPASFEEGHFPAFVNAIILGDWWQAQKKKWESEGESGGAGMDR